MSKPTRKPSIKANGSAPKGNVSELGRILRRLAEKHAASGARLLNRRELEREVAEWRGADFESRRDGIPLIAAEARFETRAYRGPIEFR